MLFEILSGFRSNPTHAIIQLLLTLPCLLIALTVHEYSHGRAALALGDKTALMSGRLSLNPLRHLDPIGTLMMLFFGFGFAKPVPVNLRNCTRVNYKAATVIVSLAGPISNFILAFIGVLGYRAVITIAMNIDGLPTYLYLTWLFFQYFALYNLGLGLFNLIPIPPLDGSRLLTVLLPTKIQMRFYKYENIIQLVVFALLWFGVLDAPLYAARNYVIALFEKAVSLLPFII